MSGLKETDAISIIKAREAKRRGISLKQFEDILEGWVESAKFERRAYAVAIYAKKLRLENKALRAKLEKTGT